MAERIDIDLMRSAAVQGRDWVTVALTVMAHPNAHLMAKPMKEAIGKVIFGEGEVTDAEMVVVLAGSMFLDSMEARCRTA